MSELITERLILRPHVQRDLADLTAMWTDPVVTHYIARGKPPTPGDVWARMLRYAGHWALAGFGFWALRERASGRFVGDVGFMEFRRDLEPALAHPECGWVLAAWAHGRGYATEAVRAACAWADERWSHTTCIIDPGNEPSLRVAARCGFQRVRDATLAGDPVVVFERPRGVAA